METKELEAQMVIDFEEEINETIIPIIKKLLSYAFAYGYELGQRDIQSELEKGIVNNEQE